MPLKIFTAFICMIFFSFVTTMILVVGIEMNDGDPGTPILILIGFLFITFIFSIVLIFLSIKTTPIKSLAFFIAMYLPGALVSFYSEIPMTPIAKIIGYIIGTSHILAYIPFYFSVLSFYQKSN